MKMSTFAAKVSSENEVAVIEHTIKEMQKLGEKNGAGAMANGAVSCIAAATIPLVGGLFLDGISAQDKMLFVLVLTGACVELKEEDDGIGANVSITAETIRDAFNSYTRFTGRDIRPFVPPAMVKFAGSASSLH